MKKLLLAAALLVGSASAASAQSTVVKANIFSPLVKTGSFFVEHAVGEHSSLQLGGLFTKWSIDDTSLSGFALTPEYRLYLSASKPALQGFYVGPFLRYQNLKLSTSYASIDGGGTAEASLSTYGGGVVVGHQWLFKQRFSLDTFLGPSYNGGTIKLKESSSGAGASFDAGVFKGFGIRSGVTFGLAF
ncbi:MAG TPA: DUF3575 domain-containing protein [Hymenobacter sp.]|uniref:DUF3575 domain-containing protein n=1 Tax=Hymenobacter sp. TaxID=1898978 RepID=UPI002D80425B|nr:DUF3575 domain-containing protein [Hymenobacter sp.]HET9504623.1 DUF3575 domain-containing protein [Hymenobacter sp.]